MAWNFPTELGFNGSEASGNSLDVTLSGGTDATKDAVLVAIACNNTGTTDGDLGELTSVTDSKGNSYTEIKEWTNGQGGAAAGATVAIYLSNGTVSLVIGDTVTINFANTITAKVASVVAARHAVGNTASVAGAVQTEVVDNADAGNLTIGGLANQEYLFIRMIASETNSNGIATPTSLYSGIVSTNSGTGGSEKGHMSIQGEAHVLTGTGDSSNPTLTDTTVDLASIYFALKEASSELIPSVNGGLPPQMNHYFPQIVSV